MPETRAEHLAWCKKRALEYLDPGPYQSIDSSIASMSSDLGKYEETRRDHQMTIGLMLSMRASGQLATIEKMRDFINGFN